MSRFNQLLCKWYTLFMNAQISLLYKDLIRILLMRKFHTTERISNAATL